MADDHFGSATNLIETYLDFCMADQAMHQGFDTPLEITDDTVILSYSGNGGSIFVTAGDVRQFQSEQLELCKMRNSKENSV